MSLEFFLGNELEHGDALNELILIPGNSERKMPLPSLCKRV